MPDINSQTPGSNSGTNGAHQVAVAPSGTLSRKSWKIFQLVAEFVAGFDRLAQIQPSVSIFGSYRTGASVLCPD